MASKGKGSFPASGRSYGSSFGKKLFGGEGKERGGAKFSENWRRKKHVSSTTETVRRKTDPLSEEKENN